MSFALKVWETLDRAFTETLKALGKLQKYIENNLIFQFCISKRLQLSPMCLSRGGNAQTKVYRVCICKIQLKLISYTFKHIIENSDGFWILNECFMFAY